MNAAHKYVVRHMDAAERRSLTGMRDMLDEGLRDIRNQIRGDIARYRKLRKNRAEIQKLLEEK